MTSLPKQYARSPEYFAALDGFRGLLALCVAIYHTIWLSNVNQLAFFNNGAVIIDLFFVFSGFLMYRLYGDNLGSPKQAKTFLKRRIARIYPIHLFMTFVFLGFALLRLAAHKAGVSVHDPGEILPFHSGAAENWASLISNFTLTHSMGLHESLTYNPPSWTISVEFFAYFTFAALLIWAPPKKAWHFTGIAVLIGVIYAVLSRLKPSMDITYDYGFWRCLAGFYTGVIGAWVYRGVKDKMAQKNVPPKATIWSALEIAILLVGVAFIIFCPGKLQFLCAPVLFCFVMVFAFDGGIISQFMSHKIFRYLAKISYSVYMIHVIISIFFGIFASRFMPYIAGENWNASGIGGDVYMIAYLLTVIVCAHVTYHMIEVPGRKLINKIDITRLLGGRKKAVIS